ncbi:MAG: tetratricopeptide repeat protein [Kiritimatiellae bacterium]|nr:tetratricopeptide repeat protein [Kiritimatiellia bacterium]
MKKLLWTILAGTLAASAAWAAPYVELKDGTRRQGTAIRALPDGTIRLTTQMGIQEIPKGGYAKAVADKPAELDPALQALRAKDYDKAIAALEGIVKKYRFLDWDVQAQKSLAQAYMEKGDAEKAVAAYTALFGMSDEEKNNTDTQWLQRKAMVKAGQFATLQKQLDAVAANGTRKEAAKAQNMRGDIQLQQNNLEPALLEYLRTATLFQDSADEETLGEACYKAGEVLERIRDPRAKDMFRKAATEYKRSTYAAQAQKKLQ